jgi:hypothetical protein
MRYSSRCFPTESAKHTRALRIEDDALHLGATAAIGSGGKSVNSVLSWRRAEPK